MLVADAWLSVCSQWNTTSLADGRLLWHGLNYVSVKVGLDGAAIALSPAQWAGLRLMERVAASTLNGSRG